MTWNFVTKFGGGGISLNESGRHELGTGRILVSGYRIQSNILTSSRLFKRIPLIALGSHRGRVCVWGGGGGRGRRGSASVLPHRGK